MRSIRVAILCVLPVILPAQILRGIPQAVTQQSATVLDGFSQCWSKSSLVGMDLNGAESITNTGFETNITGYVASLGTITRVTTQAQSGSASAMFLCTSSPNNGYIEANDTLKLTGTQKVTVEAWVRVANADSGKGVRILIRDAAENSLSVGGTVTLSGNTWTKLVLNFQLPGTQTGGVKIRVARVNAGRTDTMWVDNVSLTQAYDAVVLAGVNPAANAGATSQLILDEGVTSSAATNRFVFQYTASTNKHRVQLFDVVGVNTFVDSSLTFTVGQWQLAVATLNRTGNMTSYLNATAGTGASITTAGKTSGFNGIVIGYKNATASTSTYFNGSIGPVQLILFNSLPADIANIIANISATWRKKGFPHSYEGGTVVLDIDWKRYGVDISPSGNNLTPTAGPPIVKIR